MGSACAAKPTFTPDPPAAVDLLLTARYSHPVAVRWRRAGAVVAYSLQVLRAIGAGRDPGELGSADGTGPRILLRDKLNDVDLRLSLVHQLARGFARANGTFGIAEGDASFGQRVDEARVDIRVSMRRYRAAQ